MFNNDELKHKNYILFSTMAFSFFALSVFIIFSGISGIIEHKSPEVMASLSTLGNSFFAYFKYHALIIIGALSLTFSIWFLGHHSK